MSDRCLLYYITDRNQFAGDACARRRKLLDKIGEAARHGVDYIQLREKDLCSHELEQLAKEAIRVIRDNSAHQEPGGAEKLGPGTRLLINSRSDIALAAGADGVHLRSNDISPQDARAIWSASNTRNSKPEARNCIVAVSCHSADDVKRAAAEGADFAVFAAVFEKRDVPTAKPAGLEALRAACRAEIPVFALGGVTLGNARTCVEAGAAGIAGIRLFQDNDIAQVVKQLSPVLGSSR
jgi:thiamine-phosphate pyrophosphorylase